MTMTAANAREAPVLETGRLILQRPQPCDAERIARLANDRGLAQNTARVPHPYSLADAEEWLGAIQAGDPADAPFGVYLNIPEPVLIGVMGVEPYPPANALELGYWIGAPYRGRGFATEAARAVIAHTFAARAAPAVAAGCRITNLASRRVLEKCGFAFIGLGRCYMRALQREEPVDRFRLTRETWARRRA